MRKFSFMPASLKVLRWAGAQGPPGWPLHPFLPAFFQELSKPSGMFWHFRHHFYLSLPQP